VVLSSCSKDKLEDIKLEGNPHEEFEMMVPVIITNLHSFSTTGSFDNRVVINFEVSTYYLSLIQNRPYKFRLYRNGVYRTDFLSPDGMFFNDGVTPKTYNYTVSMKFTDDGFETQQSDMELITID